MKIGKLPFLFGIAWLLTACRMPDFVPIPASTNTPVVHEDCFISFHLGAWQDIDGDGIRGASEPPLEGVEFQLQGKFMQLWGYPYLTKADGWVTLLTMTPGGCGEKEFTILAELPESYESTTPPSISVSLTSSDSLFEAQFGFRAVPK